MTIWFTADSHLGHANILKYAKRPFSSVEEMDEQIIQRWNAVVAQKDEVYCLGDLLFRKSKDQAEAILTRLNGHKFLVFGNHDHGIEAHKKHFGWIKEIYSLQMHDADAPQGVRRIVLCHYAMRVWKSSHHGTWHLYGHSHGSLPDDPHSLSFDVGVDCNNFTPVSYEQVKARMAMKKFVPVDHHGDEEAG